MLIAELGLAPATKLALRAAGITSIEQLQCPANELLDIEPITGAVLYEVVRRLHAHNLGLYTNPRLRPPTENDIEILRLRVVEGLALRDIAVTCNISAERVRQRLNLRFGLSGEPPAALERRRLRGLLRPDLERIIALRLCRSEDGLPLAILLRGFADGPLGRQARAVIGRMEAKGLLTVLGNHVRPTEALRVTARSRTFPQTAGQARVSAQCGRGGGRPARAELPARQRKVCG